MTPLTAELVIASGTLLAEIPDPGQGEAPPGAEGVLTILRWAAWVVFAVAVLGILITAGAMVLNNRRGQGGEHAQSLGWIFAGCIIAASASALVGMFVG